MNRIFVKPATPQTLVRKPVNGYLAVEGEELNAESYWLRREADGDVVITPPKAATELDAAVPAFPLSLPVLATKPTKPAKKAA